MTYPHTRLFIAGEWQDAADGKTLAVFNPATGLEIGRVAHAGIPDLDRALAAAQKGFEVWRDVPAFERAKIMRRAAALMRERAADIGAVLTQENGKPLPEAKGEAMAAADIIEWFADEGMRVYGRIVPSRSLAVRQPSGKASCVSAVRKRSLPLGLTDNTKVDESPSFSASLSPSVSHRVCISRICEPSLLYWVCDSLLHAACAAGNPVRTKPRHSNWSDRKKHCMVRVPQKRLISPAGMSLPTSPKCALFIAAPGSRRKKARLSIPGSVCSMVCRCLINRRSLPHRRRCSTHNHPCGSLHARRIRRTSCPPWSACR